MGQYLALKIGLNAFLERHVFCVAQLRIGLGLTIAVAANFGVFVAFAQGTDHCLEFWGAQTHCQFPVYGLEFFQKHFAVVDLLWMTLGKCGQQVADVLLSLFARRDVELAGGFVFLGAGSEVFEGGFFLQFCQPFWRSVKVEAQRALDRDLVKAKVVVVKHFADHQLLPLQALRRIAARRGRDNGQHLAIAVKQHPAAGAVVKLAMQARDVADVVGVFGLVARVADAAALVAQAFFHGHPLVARVDELHLGLAVRFLAVGQHPDVGADAGVVEQLVGQGDHGFEPVVFNDPAADF